MTQPPSGDDPVVRALDELVRSGQLAPERARAALDASRGSAPPPTRPMPPPGEPEESESTGPRLDVIVVALGCVLLATTIALSGVYTRAENDLDWSNYGLGLLATLGLLGVAAGAYLLVKDDARKAELIAWPGALGSLGAGGMVSLAMDDNAATGYVAGLLIAALSAGGFLLVRRGAFVVTAIIGVFGTYATLLDDVFDVADGGGDNIGMLLAMALVVFAVGVTAAGWLFPATRDLGAVFAGALTVVGFVSILAALMLAEFFRQFQAGLSGTAPGGAPDPDRYHNDVYVILLLTVGLVGIWAACSWLTGHVGYRVLMLVTVTTAVPLATGALVVDHPSYWGLGFGIVGAGVLGVAGLRALGMLPGGRTPSAPPA